jgi:hypothetical protein
VSTWRTPSGPWPTHAALALRTAGAQRVSVLVVARWLNPDFGDTGDFIGEHLRRDYDPGICPWTGGTCP